MPLAPLNRKAFFDSYRLNVGKLRAPQVRALETLLSFLESDPHLSDIRHAAYVLGTVAHETAWTFEPIDERGGAAYFNKRYGPGTKVGKVLGNTQPGDGARFHGRGYVQVTGRRNARALTKALASAYGLADDLEANPDRLKDPQVAYWATSHGMRTGLFTGKKLADYIGPTRTDYRNARRIINGLDRADDIATLARKFETVLRDATRGTAALPLVGASDLAATEGASSPAPVAAGPAVETATPVPAEAQSIAESAPKANKQSLITKVAMWAGGSLSLGAAMDGVTRVSGLSKEAQVIIVAGIVLAGIVALIIAAVDHFQTKAIMSDPGKRDVK